MIEPTLSSTNQSTKPEKDTSSSEKLPPQNEMGSTLLEVQPSPSSKEQTCSPSEPSSCEKEKFEYEFSFTCSGMPPSFVTVWDTDDLSAAQRACCCNLNKEQIVYSETGNGFFKVRDEDWCFKKSPFTSSWGTHNEVGAGTSDEVLEIPVIRRRRTHQSSMSAAAILDQI